MVTNSSMKSTNTRCEMTFCLKCNCEVRPEDIRKESTFIVNDDGYVARIDDILIHRGCGGILRTLAITSL